MTSVIFSSGDSWSPSAVLSQDILCMNIFPAFKIRYVERAGQVLCCPVILRSCHIMGPTMVMVRDKPDEIVAKEMKYAIKICHFIHCS